MGENGQVTHWPNAYFFKKANLRETSRFSFKLLPNIFAKTVLQINPRAICATSLEEKISSFTNTMALRLPHTT